MKKTFIAAAVFAMCGSSCMDRALSEEGGVISNLTTKKMKDIDAHNNRFEVKNQQNTLTLNIPERVLFIGPSFPRILFNNFDIVRIDFGSGSCLRAIMACAFYCCRRLRKIIFPASLEFIGVHAFFGCRNLGDLIFPASLRHIGDEAFLGCDGTEVLHFLGDEFHIGECAFGGAGLRRIIFRSDAEGITMKDNPFGIRSKLGKVNLPGCPIVLYPGSYPFYPPCLFPGSARIDKLSLSEITGGYLWGPLQEDEDIAPLVEARFVGLDPRYIYIPKAPVKGEIPRISSNRTRLLSPPDA